MYINNLNPILFEFGPLVIRWYGVMLGVGVLVCLLTYYWLSKKDKEKLNTIYDLAIWLIIGGLVGARVGHILFYNLSYFYTNPKEIIFINHGGLSSHGLAIGLLLTAWIYQKIKKINLKDYLDLMVVPIPLLAGCIRIGNFFNSEIIGKMTDVPWGVYFAQVDSAVIMRHPQQLYEALTCFIIFVIILILYKKIQAKKPALFTFYFFLFLYFTTRFFLEFTKEPLNLYHFPLSTGQLLSIPFIIWSGWSLWKKEKI